MTNAKVIAELSKRNPEDEAEIVVVVYGDYGPQTQTGVITNVEESHELEDAPIGALCLFVNVNDMEE